MPRFISVVSILVFEILLAGFAIALMDHFRKDNPVLFFETGILAIALGYYVASKLNQPQEEPPLCKMGSRTEEWKRLRSLERGPRRPST